MPVVPATMFDAAIDRVIKDNVDFIPPYVRQCTALIVTRVMAHRSHASRLRLQGSGGAMYLRPFLFGHGAKMGLGPAPSYAFCVVASPVGAYYKGGLQVSVLRPQHGLAPGSRDGRAHPPPSPRAARPRAAALLRRSTA